MFSAFENEFKNMIKKKFKNMQYEFGKYTINKGTSNQITIHPRNLFVFVTCKQVVFGELKKMISRFYTEQAIECIIVQKEKSLDTFNLHPVGVKAIMVTTWLEKMDSINDKIEFAKESIYPNPLRFKFSNEPEIVIQYGNDKLFSITSFEDVNAVNEFQAVANKTIERMKNKILSTFVKYDKDAYFDEQKNGYYLFNRLFIFKVIRTKSHWNVYFYHTYHANNVLSANSLVEVEQQIYEIADRFAAEERLASLYR